MKKLLISAVFIVGFAGYVLTANRSTATPAGSSVLGAGTSSSAALSDAPSIPAGAAPPTPSAGVSKTPIPHTPTPVPPKPKGQYSDGTYTGSVADAYYGYIQVAAVISGGKLADVSILQYPNDRSQSIYINQQALPMLRSEAISAQSANVSGVSGASDTSAAFRQSLSSALNQARA